MFAAWAAWQAWGECSASSGGQTIRQRTRTCTNGIPGVEGCEGENEEDETCQRTTPQGDLVKPLRCKSCIKFFFGQ